MTIDKTQKTKYDRIGEMLISVLFFAFFFFYIWLAVRPEVIYHSFWLIIIDPPAFSSDISFLVDSLCTTGGITLYLTGLLSQLYYYSLAGAAVITLITMGIFVTLNLLAKPVGTFVRMICYVPMIAILVLCNRYSHPLTYMLAILVVLIVCVLYIRLRIDNETLRIAVAVFMAGSLYYAAGGASLIFLAFVSSYEIFRRKRKLSGLAIIASALFSGFVLWYYFLDTPLINAAVLLLPFSDALVDKAYIISHYVAQFFVVSIVLAVICLNIFAGFPKKESSRQKKKKRNSADRKKNLAKSPWTKPAIQFAAIAIAVTISLFKLDNPNERSRMLMTYFYQNRMWSEAVSYAESLPKGIYNINNCHDTNRALYHTGALLDEMFSFTQHIDALFLTNGRSVMAAWKLCDLFTNLGNINHAEHLAYEILATKGNINYVVDRLAIINEIKQQSASAEVFRKNIHGTINNSPLHDKNAIEQLRKFIPTSDSINIENKSAEEMLIYMLKANPENKMAFDYLMAFYLLTNQVGKIASNLHRFDNFGYDAIPRHIQEALLVHMESTGGKVDLGKKEIQKDVIEKYNRFVAIFSKAASRDAAYNALAREFGNTYFFYSSFGVSGIGL